MATVIHEPRDTRWGELGQGLGNIFTGLMEERARQRKQQMAQKAVQQAASAQNVEEMVTAMAPAVEDQDDVNAIFTLAAQRFGEEGRTKAVEVWAKLSEDSPAVPRTVHVPAKSTTQDVMRHAEDLIGAPVQLGPDPGPRVDPKTLELMGPFAETGLEPSQAANLSNAQAARANVGLRRKEFEEGRRQFDVTSEQRDEELDIRRMTAENARLKALTDGSVLGGTSVQAAQVRGFLRTNGMEPTQENFDRAAQYLQALDNMEDHMTQLEDPAGIMATQVGSDVVSARKAFILRRGSELIQNQFNSGVPIDTQSAFATAYDEAVSRYRPAGGELGGLTGKPPDAALDGTFDKPMPMPTNSAGALDRSQLTKGKWYSGPAGKVKWNGSTFEAVGQ